MTKQLKSRVVILALSALLGVAQMHAEEAAFTEPAAPTPQANRLDKTLRILSWPANSIAPRSPFGYEDRSKLARTEQFVLAGERLGFLADATTTQMALSQGHEGDPLNTLFGSNNRVGIASSMTAWELGFTYSSVVVPRWFEHTRYHTVARVAAIAGGVALTGFRAKMAMQNAQFIK